MYVQLGGMGRCQGGVSECETKICVRQGKGVGGLGGVKEEVPENFQNYFTFMWYLFCR